MIRIVLAEDQGMLRSALASLLNLEDDLEVVACADSGEDALALVDQHQPDVLITDIEMPGMSGIELAERFKAEQNRAHIIIITTFARAGYLQRALAAGVSGYLLKDTPSEELAAAVRKIVAGQQVISAGMTEGSTHYESLQSDPLSERDRKILRLVEQGLSNKQIAAQLGWSAGTVRNYLQEATAKLGVSSRIDAFRTARENGWL